MAQRAISAITRERRRLFPRPQMALAPAEVRLVSWRAVCRSTPRNPQRRRQSKQDGRDDANQEREREGRRTDADIVQSGYALGAKKPYPVQGNKSQCDARRRRPRTQATRFQSATGERSACGLRPARCARQFPFGGRRRATIAGSPGSRTRSAEQSQPLPATRSNVRRTLPTTCSRSGTIPNVSPPLGGYTSGNSCRRRAVMVSISACACARKHRASTCPVML